MKKICTLAALLSATSCSFGAVALDASALEKYVEKFNADDNEIYVEAVPNSRAAEFLAANVPLFDCPDKELEKIYYFRWWTFRKHIKKTEKGWVITEFSPSVGWGGKYNIISCPAGWHAREGRWLKDDSIVRDYLKILMADGSRSRNYTFAAARAFLDFDEARALPEDSKFISESYPILKNNMSEWEKKHRPDASALFWQTDNAEGQECSVAGAQCSEESMAKFKEFAFFTNARGLRPGFNSYMYADYDALSQIAVAAGNKAEAAEYRQKADRLKELINSQLWNDSAKFYMTRSAFGDNKMTDVRELSGYVPWLFGIAPDYASEAWKQLTDEEGFKAPFGPTTAERRHPLFRITRKGHECQWAGASWPYLTGSTLISLANHLNENPFPALTKKDYYDLLSTYVRTHYMTWGSGKVVPWIDESADPFTGEWISRAQMMNWNEKGWYCKVKGNVIERGKDYNHSVFCDVVISGLVGVNPRSGRLVEISPLVPDEWDFFCLDNLPVKGRTLTVMYDKTGGHYNKLKGFSIFVDGKLVKNLPAPAKTNIEL